MLFSVGVKAEEAKVVNAMKSSQKVSVDGKSVEISAYNIGGSNYFKLRDIAVILSGTEKEFDIGFDKEKNLINIEPGKAYSEAGDGVSEITKKNATGVKKELRYMLDNLDYAVYPINIDNSNYFKFRDLAKILDFSIEYDNVKKEIMIVTKDIDFVEEKEFNDGDDIKMLGPVNLSSIKNLNNSINDKYKLDIEENGDKIKFYVNIDGKKERFYLCDYYGNFFKNTLRGAPKERYKEEFYAYSREMIQFYKDVHENVEKSGGVNLKAKLPYYNYIFFIKPDGTEGSNVVLIAKQANTTVFLTNLLRELDLKSDKGYSLPLELAYHNVLNVVNPAEIIDNVKKDGRGGFTYKGDSIYVGKFKAYSMDKNGNINLEDMWFKTSKDFDTDKNLFIMDFNINRIKGKILVYLIK